MQDIAPELLKRIQSDFRDKCRSDKELGKLIDKIDSGKGDFRDAQGFAEHIGDRLGEAYVKNLTEETLPNGRLYRNIAEKVIAPTLERNHDLVCDASGKVEQALNEEAGIGLKVQVPELDQDRLNGLIDHVSDHEDPFTAEKAEELADLTENFTHHVVDAFIEKNADAHYAAGLSPKIERDAMAECCAWCLDLAGTYDYPLKDRSVYQRHKDCRCVVDYHPGNGKVQNVHSKEWRDETDSDILEARKTIGLEPLVDPAKVEQRKQAENNKDNEITKRGIQYIEKKEGDSKPDFYVGENKKILPVVYSDWIGDNRMKEYLDAAHSEEVKRYIISDFRKKSFIGDGSTAAIREFELSTGLNCGRNGKNHAQKVEDLTRQIKRCLSKDLPESDILFLQKMLDRLERLQ